MIQIATSAATTTVVITGDLTLVARDQFPEMTARVSGLRRQLLVLDMCRMTSIDAVGAAFVMSLADSARSRGGAAVLRGGNAHVLFTLETCGALGSFRVDADHSCAEPVPLAPVLHRRTKALASRGRTVAALGPAPS